MTPLVVARGDILGCPVCKSELTTAGGDVACTECGRHFPQPADDLLDLMPHDLLTGIESWTERQALMEEWYAALVEDPEAAADSFRDDYAPYLDYLRGCDGVVLDLGGGSGVVRTLLPATATYLLVEPGMRWGEHAWPSLGPGDGPTPGIVSVRGIGEYLPVKRGSCDVVLALWTLNHVMDPKRVMAEARGALRPGGRLLVVLEDMAPTWADIAGFRVRKPRRRVRSLVVTKLRATVGSRRWPLQHDHVRIREDDFRSWIRPGFEVVRRRWPTYLTYELVAR